jgi:hypothetical protein
VRITRPRLEKYSNKSQPSRILNNNNSENITPLITSYCLLYLLMMLKNLPVEIIGTTAPLWMLSDCENATQPRGYLITPLTSPGLRRILITVSLDDTFSNALWVQGELSQCSLDESTLIYSRKSRCWKVYPGSVSARPASGIR